LVLKDVTGVFSRYFVVGFFVPTFFGLATLDLAGSKALLPKALEARDSATFLILGFAAVLGGLLLLGLNFPVIRLFEGYFLIEPSAGRVRRGAAQRLLNRQLRTYDELVQDKDSKDDLRRTLANWRLDVRFPPSRDQVLPTRLGNVIRAFELHGTTRWGLSAIATWPRIEVLLSEQERELHADAQGEFAFFLNGALISFLITAVLALDGGIDHPHPIWLVWLYVLPPAIGWLLYLGAVNSAERWGERVRSSIDLHRLELYTRLGLRVPATNDEEREIASALTNLLLWSRAIPDTYRASVSSPSPGSAAGASEGPSGDSGSGGGTSGQPGSGA
jgi:hypothetical protein